jgi:hypothetical protein
MHQIMRLLPHRQALQFDVSDAGWANGMSRTMNEHHAFTKDAVKL